MKKLLYIFFLLISMKGLAQPAGFTPVSGKYEWTGGNFFRFGLPKDSFVVSGRDTLYGWIARPGVNGRAGDSLYFYSDIQRKWILFSNGGLGPNAGYGLTGTSTHKVDTFKITTKWYVDSSIKNSKIINKTYAELTADIAATALVPGQLYKITDFKTVHTIWAGAGADHTGSVEALIVRAIATNKLAPEAYSPSHPEDEINYSVTDTTALAPSTGSFGVITYRHDTRYNLSAYYDFRSVVWRRWGLVVGAAYFCYTANTPAADATDYRDTLTFQSGCHDISLDYGSYNVTIESNCYGITIGKYCGTPGAGIYISTSCHGITIDNEASKVVVTGSGYTGGIFIGSASRYINIGKRSYSVYVGTDCYAIDLGMQNSDVIVPDHSFRRRIEKGFSNLEVTLSVSGNKIDLYNTTISIFSGLLYNTAISAGIVYVSGSGTVNVDVLSALATSVTFHDIRIIPDTGLTLVFRDKLNNATGGRNLDFGGSNITINGSKHQEIVLHKRMVDGTGSQPADFYLSYTNIPVGSGNLDSLFNGNRPFTLNDPNLLGYNPGTTDIKAFLEATFYPSQSPTAALTITYSSTTSSSIDLEQMSSGSALSITLNWTGGRQTSTATLSTINVESVNQTFFQPSAPGSVSGTKSSTAARNTTSTYTNTVTTSDGKTASATASIHFYYKRYYGFVSSNSPSDGTIQALTNEFITTRIRGVTSPQSPSGSQFFCIAFPESFDVSNVSQIWVGGLDQTASFNRTTQSFTNASGATSSYIVYTSKLPTSGDVSFEIK